MKLFYVFAVGVLLYGCNLDQRKAAIEGVGKSIGVVSYPDGTINKNEDGTPKLDGKPDYVTTEVLQAFGSGVLQRAGEPVDLITYILTALAGAGLGWGGEALRQRKKVEPEKKVPPPLPSMFQDPPK